MRAQMYSKRNERAAEAEMMLCPTSSGDVVSVLLTGQFEITVRKGDKTEEHLSHTNDPLHRKLELSKIPRVQKAGGAIFHLPLIPRYFCTLNLSKDSNLQQQSALHETFLTSQFATPLAANRSDQSAALFSTPVRSILLQSLYTTHLKICCAKSL